MVVLVVEGLVGAFVGHAIHCSSPGGGSGSRGGGGGRSAGDCCCRWSTLERNQFDQHILSLGHLPDNVVVDEQRDAIARRADRALDAFGVKVELGRDGGDQVRRRASREVDGAVVRVLERDRGRVGRGADVEAGDWKLDS